MPAARVYTFLPDIAEIQKINGPIIVEEPAGGSFTAANVGVACVIGETVKGTPNVPMYITNPGDLLSTFGGFLPFAGDGEDYAYDGNLFLSIAGGMPFSGLIVVSVDDRVGEVDLARTAPGFATLTSLDLGPFALADADTLIVAIEGPVTDGTVTIQAAAAAAECATAETYDLTTVGNRTLTLAVNGGPTQSKTILVGDVVAIGAVTAEEIRDWANIQFAGVAFSATTANTKVTCTTDRKGLSASLQFGGAMRSILGFSASLIQSSQLAADNTVQNVDAVTTDELVDLLNAQLSDVTAENVGEALRFTRDLEGSGASVTLSGTVPGTGAGKIDYTSLTASGGTGTAEAGVLPGGLRVSDGGSNVFFLAEDVSFAEDVLTATGVKIKQASGTTVGIAAIDTIVDTTFVPPEITGLTVTNGAVTTAKPASESAWLVKYQAALTALEANADPSNKANLLFVARHGVKGVAIASLTGSISKAVKDHCVSMSAKGFFRIAIVSPPLGTTKTIARGSTGVGVSATAAGGRHERKFYGWPGIKKYVQEIVQNDQTLDGIIDWPSDSAIASKLSKLAPVLSLAEADDYLSYMLDLESYYTAEGTGGALTLDDYIANKLAGIISPEIDLDNGPVFNASVTSVNPSLEPDKVQASDRRARDWIERALIQGVAKKQSKLNTPSRRRAVIGDLHSFLKGLKEQELIADFSVKDVTPASFKGRGIFVVQVGVQLLDHLDNIIFRVNIGTTVDVKAL